MNLTPGQISSFTHSLNKHALSVILSVNHRHKEKGWYKLRFWLIQDKVESLTVWVKYRVLKFHSYFWKLKNIFQLSKGSPKLHKNSLSSNDLPLWCQCIKVLVATGILFLHRERAHKRYDAYLLSERNMLPRVGSERLCSTSNNGPVTWGSYT